MERETGGALTIELPHFLRLVRAMQTLYKKPEQYRAAEAALEFDGVQATFTLPGLGLSLPAAGIWAGRACFSVNLMLGLMQVPPTTKLLRIRTDGRRISIDGASVPCSWRPAILDEGEGSFALPEPRDHLHMLQILEHFPLQVIREQMLQGRIGAAKRWRSQLLVRALQYLGPLGVTHEDLEDVVTRALKRQADGGSGKRSRP